MAPPPGLLQFLNYLRFVDEGIIELKDGALFTCFALWGDDLEYAPYLHMDWIANHLSEAIHLSSGWMIESHTLRVPVVVPPMVHHCPDPTSALVYEESANRYATEGEHFTERHVLAITYLPPDGIRQEFSHLFFDGRRRNRQASRLQLVRLFQSATDGLVEALRGRLALRRLTDKQTVHFLHTCVTGTAHFVGIPEGKDRLDAAIGTAAWAPHVGRIGDLHLRVVGIIGYPGEDGSQTHGGTIPQMFDPVLQLPFPLRMQHRLIFLDTQTAVRELKRKKTFWNQLNDYNLWRGFWTVAAPSSGADPNNERVVSRSTDADHQSNSVRREIETVESGAVSEGLHTMCVVLHHAEEAVVEERAARVAVEVTRLGFSAIIERDNLASATRGSWPGHGSENIRRALLNTRHFTRLWPTSTKWLGEVQAPCPFFPEGSGPLLITKTTGKTPYFHNVHKHDLGNHLIIGFSGAGKSYYVGREALGFVQYPGAQVRILDRDQAQLPVTLACGGAYYQAARLHYAPLARVDEEPERVWAMRFLTECARLRHVTMTPQGEIDLQRALDVLATRKPKQRTMTHFVSQLQTDEAGLKHALTYYTLGNAGRLLDGDPGPAQTARWQSYDMQDVLAMGEDISTPVIMHLVHQMHRDMQGAPFLLLAEEGWQIMANEHLAEETEEGAANYRKRNACFGIVLHSPANLTQWKRQDLLRINLGSMILLPNELALSTGENGLRDHYLSLGLTTRDCEILATGMRPRQDYLCIKGEHRRVFELACGPLAHAILSVNGRDAAPRILELVDSYGDAWVPQWLKERKLTDLAQQWQTRKMEQVREAACLTK